jgi:hypothetical protein
MFNAWKKKKTVITEHGWVWDWHIIEIYFS